MRRFLFSVLCVVAFNTGYGATITAKTGAWSWGDTNAWDLGRLPVDGDNIIVPIGAIVSLEFFTEYDFRTGGLSTTITIESGGILNGIGFCGFSLSTGTGPDVFVVEAGGIINPNVYFNFDGSGYFSADVRVSILPGPVNVATVPGPATIANGALPVELLYFNAETREELVELFWATASEENFDHFAIERSADGLNFKEIAQVSGAGFSMSRLDYSYIDNFPLQGNSYYRLRSIDFDGYTEIFDYVMVNIDDQIAKFTVYPNPIENGSFNVQTNFASEESMQLIVYNNMGVIQKTFEVTDWLDSYSFSSIQPGTYMFKLVGSDEVLVQRVLIK